MTDFPPARRRPARAIVASGFQLLREGLTGALDRSGAITVTASVGDADEARATISDLEPDVVLLDIEMPDSLQLVRAVHAGQHSPRIIAFTVSEADDALVGYIEAGIDGYVTRAGSLKDFVATVESVGRGETIVSPKLAATLFERARAANDASLSGLGDRGTARRE